MTLSKSRFKGIVQRELTGVETRLKRCVLINYLVGNIFYIYNLFTKSTDKIHCRYEAPREEPREAHGYLALGCDGYMVALSVDVDR